MKAGRKQKKEEVVPSELIHLASQPARYQILNLLHVNGTLDWNPGSAKDSREYELFWSNNLANKVGLSKGDVQFHLDELRRLGLVTSETRLNNFEKLHRKYTVKHNIITPLGLLVFNTIRFGIRKINKLIEDKDVK